MTALTLDIPHSPLPPGVALEAAALHAAAFEGLERPYSAAELAAICDGRTGFLLTASDAAPDLPVQPPLVGFVAFRVVEDDAEILVVAVAPTDQRRGIGTQLVAAAEDRARELGAERMFLEVAETNHPARALYLGAGYAEMGRRKHYYRRPNGQREDALMLHRRL